MSRECVDCGRESPPNCGCIQKWPQDIWENITIEWLQSRGWNCDLNDEKALGFTLIDREHHWMRDYDKKTRRFIQFDGNQKGINNEIQ